MKIELKVCGITRLEDARYCAAAGADYLGFVQHAASPRYVSASGAREIIDWVYGPIAVGVFVNRRPSEVNLEVAEAGFALAQLHGDESPEDCAAVDVPVIKAIRIGPGARPKDVAALAERYRGAVTAFLLDSRVDGLWGGSGKSFDWTMATELPDDIRVFLAGGIGASNLESAVRTVRPHVVDVSSSLESSPGIKDFEKVDAFIDAFRRLDAEITEPVSDASTSDESASGEPPFR